VNVLIGLLLVVSGLVALCLLGLREPFGWAGLGLVVLVVLAASIRGDHR
jgi:hypothetical protein